MTNTSTPQEEREDLGSRVRELLGAGETARAGDLAEAMHASDLADLLEELDDELRIPLLSAVSVELASGTLAEMEEAEGRAELFSTLNPELRSELLHELPDDDAADLIGELEPPEQLRVLEELEPEEAGELLGLLKYEEDSAGGLMTTELVALRAVLSGAEALEEVRLQGREVEDFYTVFVVDDGGRLLGTVRLDDLVIADPASNIGELVEAPAATVHPLEDQEEVGRLISRYNLAAIPVVGTTASCWAASPSTT